MSDKLLSEAKKMSEPTVEQAELARQLTEAALNLCRGCDCACNYECKNCQRIVATREIASKLSAMLTAKKKDNNPAAPSGEPGDVMSNVPDSELLLAQAEIIRSQSGTISALRGEHEKLKLRAEFEELRSQERIAALEAQVKQLRAPLDPVMRDTIGNWVNWLRTYRDGMAAYEADQISVPPLMTPGTAGDIAAYLSAALTAAPKGEGE